MKSPQEQREILPDVSNRISCVDRNVEIECAVPVRRYCQRANAAKSTGPTSQEGRARSAQNSRKHGFTASKFAILAVEDPQDLENLKADIIHTYQPVNHMELITCERIATTFFIMQRAAQFEAGMFTCYLNLGLHSADNVMEELRGQFEPGAGQDGAFTIARGVHLYSKQHLDFNLLLRYKAQAERDYRRAVEEFEHLRKLRPELAEFPNEPISDEEPTPSREAPTDPRPPIPDSHFAPAPGSWPLAPAQQLPARDPDRLLSSD